MKYHAIFFFSFPHKVHHMVSEKIFLKVPIYFVAKNC